MAASNQCLIESCKWHLWRGKGENKQNPPGNVWKITDTTAYYRLREAFPFFLPFSFLHWSNDLNSQSEWFSHRRAASNSTCIVSQKSCEKDCPVSTVGRVWGLFWNSSQQLFQVNKTRPLSEWMGRRALTSAVIKHRIGFWEEGQDMCHTTTISGVTDFLFKMLQLS